MRAERGAAAVIAAGAALLLVSLYLPWKLHQHGWVLPAASPVVLSALLLGTLALACAVRPSLVARLPLGAAALASGVFVLYLAVEAMFESERRPRYHLSGFGAGAYVAVVVTGMALVGAGVLRSGEARVRPVLRSLQNVTAVAVALALLLPSASYQGFGAPGVLSVTATGIGACACAVVGARLPALRLTFALAALVLAGASAWELSRLATLEYGSWLALGLGVALVGLTAAEAPFRPVPPSLAVAPALCALLVASLFLPWQRLCGTGPAGAATGCRTTYGWDSGLGIAAGIVAVLLAGVVLLRATRAVSTGELVAALALLVAVWGELLSRGEPGLPASLRYGAIVGFVATALLVLLELARMPRRLPVVRPVAVPLALSAAVLLLVGLSAVDVLTGRARWTSWGSWLGVAGLLLALVLVVRWALRRRDDGWLRVLVPLELYAITVLPLLERRELASWGDGAVAALALGLAWLGWVERTRGLENFQLPGILRIDRL